MNKLLLLTVACALLISSVGATSTVSSTQIGHSPFYYFDVTYNGKAVGYVVVNTANAQAPTYVLVANGLTPNTKYTFGCTVSGDIHTLGSANTTTTGALVTHGTFPAADVKDLRSAQFWVTETPPGGSYQAVGAMSLYNHNGFFVAQLKCYYSFDEGVTWHDTASAVKGIAIGQTGYAVGLSYLGVAPGDLVKIHAVVVGGKDRTGSEVFRYESGACLVQYEISGATLNPHLVYDGVCCSCGVPYPCTLCVA